jgi:predicted metal-dependent phosphoesterase TrpH
MDKKRLEPETAIKIIKEAGGVAVLAHPYQTKLDDKALENLIKELCSYGLGGIEVFYSEHTPEMIEKYAKLADNYSLMKTSGSDFHGLNKPEISLGMEVVKEDVDDFLQFAIEKRYQAQG